MDKCENESTHKIKVDPASVIPNHAICRKTEEEAIAEENSKLNATRWNNWNRLVGERGKRYEDCRLRNYTVNSPEQQNSVNRLTEYLDSIEKRIEGGEGLLLFGPKGCGKDHLLMACARVAIGHDFKVQWLNGMDLFARLRGAMDPDAYDTEESIFHELRKPRILWISDPAPPTGSLTEYQQSFLFRLLDYRYSHLLTTWVCCNVTSGADLDARIGAQNGDRLRHGAHAIFTNWESFRKVSTTKQEIDNQ